METLPNVLIVDDTEINLTFLEFIIKEVNINLIQALSGSEALEKIRGIELALAIIDVRMPVMNGYELALKINEERPELKVPIIFLTANYFSEKEVLKGYNSGAVDYIFKPINSHILLSKINIFLDLFNQKQTIARNAAILKKSADDLTHAYASLKKSKKKHQRYIESAPDGILITDEKGKYKRVNKALCLITGYAKRELLKMSIPDLLPEESFEYGLAQFRMLVDSGTSKADLLFTHKNGDRRWEAIESVKLSETRFLSFIKDITERKEMEEILKLQQTELEKQNDKLTMAMEKAQVASEKYAELYDFAPSGYFTLSSEKSILELNHSGARLLGKKRPHLIDSYFDSFISKNSQPVFNAFFANSFKSKTKEICEVMIETASSQPRYVHIEGLVASNKKQCLLNVIDISDRKQAEQALKVSEEKYKTILNASPDGILLMNLRGIITEVSEIGLEILGADDRGGLIGKHFLRFIPTEEKDTTRGVVEKTINEGIAQNIEIKIKKKNHSLFLSEISITLIQNLDGSPFSFMITIRDISLRKKMEKKQIHADRMVSLGEMASGIAHEINQPLNTISLAVDNVLYEVTKDDNIGKNYLKKKAEKIFENITRIRSIIDHIRAFSRSNDDYILTGFDINSSINNAVTMISEQFEHLGIALNLQLEENPPVIIGNTFIFEQVILNLLSNAKDALLEKKNNHKIPYDMVVGIRSFQENQYLIVEITDNGIGISEEDMEHIILPFYTTKDTGQGTGLGLSISYQIIKEMNGTIEISSNINDGATFKIILKIPNKE